MLTLKSGILSAGIDEHSGRTLSLVKADDPMNWIDPLYGWGSADGFTPVSQDASGGRAVFGYIRDELHLTVTKTVSGGVYEECYILCNRGNTDFALTHGNFAFRYAFNNHLAPRKNLLHDVSLNHIWCGRHNSWICSRKPDGNPCGLTGILTEGSLADYSIGYDSSRTDNASHWRGVFLLHPENTVLRPGGELVFRFRWFFTEKRPDRELLEGQQIFAKADRYTAETGEEIHGFFELTGGCEHAEITAGGKTFPCSGNTWTCSFETPGEREIRIAAAGKETLIRVNITESAEKIPERRAHFIAEKQQFHEEGNPLDGALLIYDRSADSLVYNAAFRDSNAARERLAMGCILALSLQKKSDPVLLDSLKKYKAYLEREIVDPDGTVYDDIRHNPFPRAYNYPWAADFCLECGKALHDPECFRTAAKIMLKYYSLAEKTGQDSPCIEDYRIVQALDDTVLADQLKKAALRHADGILENSSAMYSEEVSYTQVQFSMKITSLCHAWQFTGNTEYLEAVPALLEKASAFSAEQPDFHCFGQGIRYWDLYWFGKMKSYGDTMPQWLSACHARALVQYGSIINESSLVNTGKAILKNALCLYDNTGFGSAGYLVPWKVHVYGTEKPHFKPGTAYGGRYDAYANDQDWFLYYATLYNIL